MISGICFCCPPDDCIHPQTLTMILDCKYKKPSHLSAECLDLISKMLVREPAKVAATIRRTAIGLVSGPKQRRFPMFYALRAASPHRSLGQSGSGCPQAIFFVFFSMSHIDFEHRPPDRGNCPPKRACLSEILSHVWLRWPKGKSAQGSTPDSMSSPGDSTKSVEKSIFFRD
jgi:hypothetical protein